MSKENSGKQYISSENNATNVNLIHEVPILEIEVDGAKPLESLSLTQKFDPENTIRPFSKLRNKIPHF